MGLSPDMSEAVPNDDKLGNRGSTLGAGCWAPEAPVLGGLDGTEHPSTGSSGLPKPPKRAMPDPWNNENSLFECNHVMPWALGCDLT